MKCAEVIKGRNRVFPVLGAEAFIEAEGKPVSMGKITQKEIKKIARALELAYDDEKIFFVKKILAHWKTKQ